MCQVETDIPLLAEAELHGLFKGIELLISREFNQVIIEGDALLIHKAFQQK